MAEVVDFVSFSEALPIAATALTNAVAESPHTESDSVTACSFIKVRGTEFVLYLAPVAAARERGLVP